MPSLNASEPGELERQLVAVDGVERAVVHGRLEVDDRVAGQVAAQPRVLDALLDGGNELPRNRAAEDVVLEHEVCAARQRLHPDLAVAELAVAAGLLLVAAVRLDRRGDRLAIRDPGRLEVHLDAEAPFQLRDGDLDVQLSLPGEQQLLRLRIAHVADGRVLFLEAVHRRADLVFVAAALRLDRVRQHRLGERDRRERPGPSALSASVSLVSVSFSLATAPRSPARSSGTLVAVLPCITDQVPEPLRRLPRHVEHGRIGLERARHHAEQRDAPGERIGHRLPDERGVRARRRGLARDLLARRRIERAERPLSGRRQIVDDGVEHERDADVRQRRGAHERSNLAGAARPCAGR